MNTTLTVAILREQVGDKNDVCFPETKDTHKFLIIHTFVFETGRNVTEIATAI